jgi:hypothetical protein
MVFVTMGKIDATLRKCSELLECLELQGIAARAITRDGLGLVGGNPAVTHMMQISTYRPQEFAQARAAHFRA